MIGAEVNCARQECGKSFSKATHNQKFCSSDCCKIETNRKMVEKYHERAAIKRGKKRSCKSCGTSLSRYNDSTICGACETKKHKESAGSARALISSVTWL